MTRRIMRELQNSAMDKVDAKQIIKEGDWIIKWSESSKSDSGFELFTPEDFNPEEKESPLGGLVLAAVYYILEHGHPNFGQNLVAMANDLAKEVHRELYESVNPDRVLN